MSEMKINFDEGITKLADAIEKVVDIESVRINVYSTNTSEKGL